MITVLCKRGAGIRESEPISDSLISDRYAAAKRGKRFFDDPDQGGFYRVKRVGIRVPFRGFHVSPGKFITITDIEAGYRDVLLKVLSVKTSFSSDNVFSDIEGLVFIK